MPGWSFKENRKQYGRPCDTRAYRKRRPAKHNYKLFEPVPAAKDVVGDMTAWLDVQHWRFGAAVVPRKWDDKEVPKAMYYEIHLTLKAKKLLRFAIRDLWEEGLVQGVFDAAKGRVKMDIDFHREVLRQYCVEMVSSEKIAEVFKKKSGVSPRRIHRVIETAMQLVVTSITPKHMRDQLILVALGERRPNFTHKEIQKLLKQQGWHDRTK